MRDRVGTGSTATPTGIGHDEGNGTLPPLRGEGGVGAETSWACALLNGLRRLTVYARTMRKQPTDAEAVLWRRLRGRQLGVRFRRQHPVAGYIIDFYCPEARLAIELDGGGHADANQRRYDERRDRTLTEQGIRVMRLWNPDVLREQEAVLELIWTCVHGAPVPQNPHLNPPPQAGEGAVGVAPRFANALRRS